MTLQQRVVSTDYQRWLRNTALFLAPAVLLALTALEGGSSWEEIAWILRLWLINALIDLTRKFMAANGS